MGTNITEELKSELDLLGREKENGSLNVDLKKKAFAEELKSEVGAILKNDISNPDRHNPKSLSFWAKFKKAIGC